MDRSGILTAEELRRSLRLVKLEKDPVDLSLFPSFLIIGPQRTGTTWLHANLALHPEVFLPSTKELFFFSRLRPTHRLHRTNELADYLRSFKQTPWSYIKRQVHSLVRYRERYRPEVSGEATATYAALDPDLISEIVAINPEIKAILMVRDPVERAWSHAKKDIPGLGTNGDCDPSMDRLARTFFTDPHQVRCGRYSELIATWRRALKDDHLLVDLFDEIEKRPQALLQRVSTFLGIRYDPKYFVRLADRRINMKSTPHGEVPTRYREFLEELFADEIEGLPPLRQWLTDDDARLSEAPRA